MINYIKIFGVLLGILSLSSCVKDGETLCPEGQIKLNFYAEKFQNKSQNPLDDKEEVFADRIGHIRYYLYKDGKLIEDKVYDKFTNGDHFSLTYQNLDYGKYEAVVVANSKKTSLTGDPVKSANLLLTYPGYANTEDFFTAVFPFTVNSTESKEYEVGLLRAHGVVRYTFVNMPADLSDVEVAVKNVRNEKWVTGDYADICEANHKYATLQVVTRQSIADTQGFVLGTFPTPTNEKSQYYMSLYRQGEENSYYSTMITDTLSIPRNQLVDIIATFNDGNVGFEVQLDNEWDGSVLGGIGEVK